MARLVRLGEANIGVWGGQSVAPRLADHLLLSGKGYRGKGVAAVALEGAIEQIKNWTVGASRAIRRTPRAEMPHRHSCSTGRCPRSNAWDSRDRD
jgi:hypothetical protein